MRVTFKTVTQQVFTLELDPLDTIANVKAKIEAQEKHPVALQKIIFAGKVLSDEKTIGEFGVKDKDLVVLMVAKPKTAPSTSSAAAATPAITTSATDSTTPSRTTSAQPSAPESATTPAAAPTSTPITSSAPSATAAAPEAFSGLATGSALQSAKASLMELGYSQQEVDSAMRAAFNNPDRAAEYLLTGIPDNIAAEMTAQPPANTAAQGGQAPAVGARPAATQGAPAAAAAQQPGGYVNLFEQAAQQAQQQPAGVGGGLGAAGLGQLRNSPQFAQMRQMIQQNPQLMQPLLQQLAATNPQLIPLIQQNPDAFLQALAGGDEGEEGDEGGAGGFGMPQVVHITPEEDAAINRLVALGFERAMAIEAFLACDKNEELAANYLFDQMGGDLQ